MGKKRKALQDGEFDPAPKHLVVSHVKDQEKRLIIILENAQLESVKVCISMNPLTLELIWLGKKLHPTFLSS